MGSFRYSVLNVMDESREVSLFECRLVGAVSGCVLGGRRSSRSFLARGMGAVLIFGFSRPVTFI